MSLLDRVVAAVTAADGDEVRQSARAKAQSATSPGDWLSLVLEHHDDIEAAFASVRATTTDVFRSAALRKLAILLTGHANAEESVLYPALAGANEKAHAMSAYAEQAAAKIQLGLLEAGPAMSNDFVEKLDALRDAVIHHMFEEESSWFQELKEKVPADEQTRLSQRYAEEFNRYVRDESKLAPPQILASAS